MIALSASTLVNAGPEPLDLFGVSDWREGCPTLRRHDHGNSPVRPMTVDAPLPHAPQIGPFVGQMQHTNDVGVGMTGMWSGMTDVLRVRDGGRG